MARFNKKNVRRTRTINVAGGDAYKESPKLELISALLTFFVQDQFYRSENKGIGNLVSLMKQVDPLFAAKSAVFARNEFGMRSVSHIVAGELAHNVSGERWLRRFLDKVVHRVDDTMEIFSYYMNKYGKPYPSRLKRGLSDALQKFDAYQFAKYRGESRDLSLVDLINLIHAKPHNGNAEVFRKLMAGELKSSGTWETKVSEAGKSENKKEAKAKAWRDLVLERKIGYMALLKNLRNILKDSPDIVDEACLMLTDGRLIKKSLVLPFRYDTAMREIMSCHIDGQRKVMIALNEALDISCSNVPKFDGKTCVILDESGSMRGKPWDIGSLFAAVLVKSNDADLVTFASSARYQAVNPLDSVMTIKNSMHYSSGGTFLSKALQTLNKKYDRLVILSDMQSWMESGMWGDSTTSVKSAFANYKRKYKDCSPIVYSWDLQGYGTLQFPERNVFCLAGFSEKVFSLMSMLEQDKNALIKKVEAVEI